MNEPIRNNHAAAETAALITDWKAALYMRISKEDGDKEESDSITNQRELLYSFAKSAPGIAVVSERADDGFSGASFQRPYFQKMMEDIKNGLVNCVIVKNLSRLGRDMADTILYLHELRKNGIIFATMNDSVSGIRPWVSPVYIPGYMLDRCLEERKQERLVQKN